MEGQKEQTRQKEHVRLEFESNSRNEEFARVVAAVFMSRLDPTLEETQDVKKAMEPLYTTDTTGERSGMGFSFMEAFMDEVTVESEPGKGTAVTMKKHIGR